MPRPAKPTFVDVGNSAMAIDCPNCGLLTARFSQYCRNCGFSLWPSPEFVSAAFQAWKSADPARAEASPFDLELPTPGGPVEIDYDERAHRLGIHIFPSSNYPFVICVGFFFLALAAVPFATVARIILAVIGAVVFLIGLVGWVVVEDVRMYPGDTVITHSPPADGHEAEQAHAEESR
jgi:hypothetical protein